MPGSPKTTPTSLLDTAGQLVSTWYVVYHWRHPHFWWQKYIKQGFRHVELTRPAYFGPGIEDCVWLNILPQFELLNAEICTDPRPPWVRCPDSTVQKVTAIKPRYKLRSWFDIGPPTCVEVVKMALGIRALWVRTPWQLYQYIHKRGGIIGGQ